MRDQHLDILEAEAIFIMRETFADFKKPVILFSGGKDSITLVHLAQKAFYPQKIPFSLLHIDTGHNFEETISFRDELVKRLQLSLVVSKVQDFIDQGALIEEKGKIPSRNAMQSHALLDAIAKNGFDACIGGGRRDEEKSRAKERFFSLRSEFGEWNPQNQRPEFWNLFNTNLNQGQNMRIFPLSNWTELDVWRYIKHEQIPLPSLYFSHRRKCIEVNGILLPVSPFIKIEPSDKVEEKVIRFRTIGDMTCTAAFESTASTIEEVVDEIEKVRTTERNARLDDKRSKTAMEDRKKQGYF